MQYITPTPPSSCTFLAKPGSSLPFDFFPGPLGNILLFVSIFSMETL